MIMGDLFWIGLNILTLFVTLCLMKIVFNANHERRSTLDEKCQPQVQLGVLNFK